MDLADLVPADGWVQAHVVVEQNGLDRAGGGEDSVPGRAKAVVQRETWGFYSL